jgi:hypothetical protein
MEYAVAEGFLSVFYWPKQNTQTSGSNEDSIFDGYVCKVTWIEFTVSDKGNHVTVFGEKFHVDDNFYMDYGILCNDEVDGMNQAQKWKDDRADFLDMYDEEIAPQIKGVLS